MPNWMCHAATRLPIDEERSWDGAAAKARMLDAAGIGGDNPRPATARRGFLLVDDEAPELRGSYSLPFADLVDGRLTALASGLRAAASRLPQKDGVSDEQRDKARRVLDGYFARLDDEDEEEERAQEVVDRGEVFAHPASLVARATAADLLEIAKARLALDPSVLAVHPPFLFTAQVSNQNLDAYFTRMHKSSLRNFAADADDGIALQNSHRSWELSLGRSLRGKYFGGQGSGASRTEVDFAVIPGLKLTEIATDDFILGVKSGTVRDVSVGFYGGTIRCSICGRDMWRDWECHHWPGTEYTRRDDEGEEGEAELAVGWVEDAHLAEVSAVYDGATPGAVILKAHREVEAGRLRPADIRAMEIRYRAKLHGFERLWPGLTATPGDRSGDEPGINPKGTAMPEKTTPEPSGDLQVLQATWRSIEDALADIGYPASAERGASPSVIRSLGAELVELRPLRDKVAAIEERLRDLEPRAKDGEQYRADLIEETLIEYVRALKDKAKPDTKRLSLESLPLAAIKQERDEYRELAGPNYPGGRATLDQAEDPPPAAIASLIPAAAYRA